MSYSAAAVARWKAKNRKKIAEYNRVWRARKKARAMAQINPVPVAHVKAPTVKRVFTPEAVARCKFSQTRRRSRARLLRQVFTPHMKLRLCLILKRIDAPLG